MSETLAGPSSQAVCPRCSRAVHIVRIDGLAVAIEPAVEAFVLVDRGGRTVRSSSVSHGRRVHADLCVTYQLEAERKKRRADLDAERATVALRKPRRSRSL